MLIVMKQWILISLGWLSIAAAVIACLFIFTGLFKASPIPENIRRQLDFAIYYPAQLPNGYLIQDDSYEVINGTLSYTIGGLQKPPISVSQQSPPETFDFEKFHNETLKNKHTTNTDTSSVAYIGRLEANNVVSLRTDTTWILLTADRSKVSFETLEKIAKKLRT
jgi:replication initiation and membrane attachment protein DnaB